MTVVSAYEYSTEVSLELFLWEVNLKKKITAFLGISWDQLYPLNRNSTFSSSSAKLLAFL